MKNTFKVGGDPVTLKSGGPPMTILKVTDHSILVSWMNGTTMETANLPPEALKIYAPSEAIISAKE